MWQVLSVLLVVLALFVLVDFKMRALNLDSEFLVKVDVVYVLNS